MKFAIQLFTIFLLAFIFELFLPWWSIAIAAFAGGMIFNTRANFVAGFFAIAMLWVLKALWIDSHAAAPLADRVAAIFMLNKPLLYLVMGILGGLVGGFAAMTGAALHAGRRKANYY